jgi:ABC-2 type transport system permease protein
MRNNWKLYFKYIRMHFLVGLEYKGWWLAIIQQFLMCIIELLPTWLMFYRMGSIGEWTMERILLIYSLATASFGIAEAFCDGFAAFPWNMLRQGNFDRLLLRPKSLPLQVAGSVFSLYRLTRAVAGIGIAIWAMNRLGVAPTPFNVLVIILAVMGGVLMYSGIFIMSSGIAFFTIKALDWIYIFTYASYQITRIPITYMPQWIKGMFTFLVPLLVISYYPAAAVGGWGNPYLGLIAFPAGVVFLRVSLWIWTFGVRHYKSTGS